MKVVIYCPNCVKKYGKYHKLFVSELLKTEGTIEIYCKHCKQVQTIHYFNDNNDEYYK